MAGTHAPVAQREDSISLDIATLSASEVKFRDARWLPGGRLRVAGALRGGRTGAAASADPPNVNSATLTAQSPARPRADARGMSNALPLLAVMALAGVVRLWGLGGQPILYFD